MNRKGFINMLVIVIVVVLIGARIYVVLTRQTVSPTPTMSSSPISTPTPTPTQTPKLISSPISDMPGIIVSTDKTGYDRGEIIKIVVNNKLDTSVLYSSGGDRFWSIEYFKDDKWINLDREEGVGFQLTRRNIGETCSVKFYERGLLVALKSGGSLSYQWNQRICPFGTTSPAEPSSVRYIESGQYRITFAYGSKISSEDSYTLPDVKIVYSNSFLIK